MAFPLGYHCTCLILGGFYLFILMLGYTSLISSWHSASPTPLPQNAGTISPWVGREAEARRVSAAEREHFFTILQPTASGAEKLGLWGYFSSKTCQKFPHLSRTDESWGEHHAGRLSLQLQFSPRICWARTHCRRSSKLSIANIHLIHCEEKQKALQACRSSERAAVSYAEPVFPLVSLISQCFAISGVLCEDTASRPSPVITGSLCFPFFSLSLFTILNQWKKKKKKRKGK